MNIMSMLMIIMLKSKMLFVFACLFLLASSEILLAQQSRTTSSTKPDLKYSFINGTNLRAVSEYLRQTSNSNNLDDNIELLQEALEDGAEERVARFVTDGRTPEFVAIAKALIALGETSDERVMCTLDNMEFFRRVADEPSPGLRISLVAQKLLLKAKNCPEYLVEGWTPEYEAELSSQFEIHNYYKELLDTRLFRELESAQTGLRGLENNIVFLSSMAKKMARAEYCRGNTGLATLKDMNDYERAWDRNFIEPCLHIVSNDRLQRLALPIANLEIAAAKFNAWEADDFDSKHYLNDWANRYMTCNVLLGLKQTRLLNVMFMRETLF